MARKRSMDGGGATAAVFDALSDSQASSGRRGTPALEALNVSKYFGTGGGSIQALDNVSFAVQRGEFLSIVGPSGCGKSTLLEILASLLQPTSGSVRIDGAVAEGRPGQVGYMAQKDLLLPWRTVLDNAILGLQARGMRRKQAREEARAYFERFGLRGFEDHYPAALSGGMRRRAAMLRTILHGQDILLLDEPFAALDALTRADLQEWLLGIQNDFSKTIVLVTHDVDEAIYLSDRVLLLSRRPGKILQTLNIEMDRPRDYQSCVLSPWFLEYKRAALAHLRSQRGGVPS